MQQHHKVKDLMTGNLVIISPESTLKEAAQKMESCNCGVLPVGTRDRLEGIITDRDIVVRAVAKGKDAAKEKVRNFMTEGVWFCSAEDAPDKAAKLMHTHHVNRLMVKDSNGDICGILTFGRMLREDESLEEIHHVIENAVGHKMAA